MKMTSNVKPTVSQMSVIQSVKCQAKFSKFLMLNTIKKRIIDNHRECSNIN